MGILYEASKFTMYAYLFASEKLVSNAVCMTALVMQEKKYKACKVVAK